MLPSLLSHFNGFFLIRLQFSPCMRSTDLLHGELLQELEVILHPVAGQTQSVAPSVVLYIKESSEFWRVHSGGSGGHN